jgi:hypothetical protein
MSAGFGNENEYDVGQIVYVNNPLHCGPHRASLKTM